MVVIGQGDMMFGKMHALWETFILSSVRGQKRKYAIIDVSRTNVLLPAMPSVVYLFVEMFVFVKVTFLAGPKAQRDAPTKVLAILSLQNEEPVKQGHHLLNLCKTRGSVEGSEIGVH